MLYASPRAAAGWGARYGAPAPAPLAGGWGGNAWGGAKGGKGGKGLGANRFQPYEVIRPKKCGPTTSVKLQPLPAGCGEAEIREVFAPHGDIQSIRIMPGQPNYAYVNYTTIQAAAAVIALNQIELGGMKVFVNPGRGKYPDASESIGLFNIPTDTPQEELEKLVSVHAGFKKLRMITKPGTTEFRGFCFADFESVDNAIAAMEALQGTWVGQKQVDVKFATTAGKGGKGGAPHWGGAPAGVWGHQQQGFW